MKAESQVRIAELQDIINNSKNLVFFGGAGVSTASGIPDFRSPNGLYSKKINNKYSPEFMLSHRFFEYHTEEFFDFYRTEMCVTDCEPCITHKKIAELENDNRKVTVVTQNIDGLHQKAGSTNVLELHGTIMKNRCVLCNKEYDVQFVKESEGIPICTECGIESAIVKPEVTLYEEQLPEGVFDKAINAIQSADVMIVAGTSLEVYPAANLVTYFNQYGDYTKKLIVINKGEIKIPIGVSMDSISMIFDDDMNEIFEQIHA